jgi:hypothetical protein
MGDYARATDDYNALLALPARTPWEVSEQDRARRLLAALRSAPTEPPVRPPLVPVAPDKVPPLGAPPPPPAAKLIPVSPPPTVTEPAAKETKEAALEVKETQPVAKAPLPEVKTLPPEAKEAPSAVKEAKATVKEPQPTLKAPPTLSSVSELGRRVALVIGNATYQIGPLQNPVNDAEAMARVLEQDLKFDKVILKRNVTADGFRAALREFAREAVGAGLAVVYYAGHGTENANKNYLIPVDAQLAKAGDLDLEAIALDTVVAQLAGVTKLKLVILDACRNNVFPLAGSNRGSTRGLYRMEPEENTLLFYAAKDGTTADDGLGRKHSPFTAALLKHIVTPGLEIRFLLGEVRDDVMAATGKSQQPHVYGTLGRERIYLR